MSHNALRKKPQSIRIWYPGHSNNARRKISVTDCEKDLGVVCRTCMSPHLEMHIDKLDTIQRRASKCAPGLANLDYNERLERLNITSLENRRIRGDLITQFKIMNGLETVNWTKPLARYGATTRGNKFRYVKELSNNSIRWNFFNNRIANVWNSLPVEVIDANSVNSFKARIDKWYKCNINSWYKGRDGDIKGGVVWSQSYYNRFSLLLMSSSLLFTTTTLI